MASNRPLTPSELIPLLEMLAEHLKGGVAPAEALACIAEDSPYRVHRKLVRSLAAAIGGGASLRDAMLKQADAFGPATIKYLELHRDGDLAQDCKALADFFAQRRTLDERVFYLNAFQTLTVWVVLLVMAFILVFVIPAFKEVFLSFGADLPSLTLFIITLSDAAIYGGWILIPLWIFRRRIRTALPKLAVALDRIPLLLPAARRKQSLVVASGVLDTLAFLEQQGCAPVEALRVAGASISNAALRQGWQQVIRAVEAGQPWAEAMAGAPVVPRSIRAQCKIASLAAVAERNRELANIAVGLYGTRSSAVVSIVLGVFIGLIIIGMYLPIFKLGSVVG